MKKNQFYFFAVAFILLMPNTVFAYGPTLQPGTVFDGITSAFQNSSSGWMNAAQGYAQSLFLSLAGIEFAWAAIQLTMKKGELQDLAASVMMKVVGIGFFYSLLMLAPSWIPAIMNSFGIAGAAVGNNGGSGAMLSPSGIFDQGINVAGSLVTAMNASNSNNVGVGQIVSSGGASIGSFLFGAIVTGLAGLMTILAFTAVAVQLMVTLIESYVVIGGGMLMLGFLGSRWTLPFGEKYFGYAVSTGIKLFTLYLIVGQGQNVANSIIQHITATGAPSPVDFLGAGASSLAYGAMGYLVPAMAGSMMNGSPSMSMGNMMGAGGGMAGTIVGAGAMAGATALSGLHAAGGFSKTTKAAGNIGGSVMPTSSGSVGGNIPGSTGLPGSTGIPGSTSTVGGGISSPVAAPPAMSGSTNSSAQTQPVPAPAAAMADNKVADAPKDSGALNKNNNAANSDATTSKTANSEVSNSNGSKTSATQSLNVSPSIKSKGNTDAITDTKKTGFDLKKKADSLNEMARRMDKLPAHDGNSGGISIRFNHID